MVINMFKYVWNEELNGILNVMYFVMFFEDMFLEIENLWKSELFLILGL